MRWAISISAIFHGQEKWIERSVRKNILVTTTSYAWSSSSGFRAFNPITPSPPSAGFKTPWRRRGVVCFGLTVRPRERQDHCCPNNERKNGFSDSLSEISLDRGEILNIKTHKVSWFPAESAWRTLHFRHSKPGPKVTENQKLFSIYSTEKSSRISNLSSPNLRQKGFLFFSARKTRENPRRHSFSDARQTTKNPPPQKGVLSTRERVGCLEYTHR